MSWIRAVRWILLYLYPPLVAVGWPALALYGALHPRLPDLDALHLRHGEVAIFIGSSATERSYIVVPRDLPHAAISRVDELGGAFTVTEHSGVALWVPIIWGLCVYGTWYFWIRPRRVGI